MNVEEDEQVGGAIALKSPLLNVRRAHAIMFLNKSEEAQALYAEYRHQRIDYERTGEDAITGDFDAFRQSGRSHPLMNDIAGVSNRGNEADSPSQTDHGYRILGPETTAGQRGPHV